VKEEVDEVDELEEEEGDENDCLFKYPLYIEE
jgi:hypothetical protein